MDKKAITPLAKNVLVSYQEEQVTSSGIILADRERKGIGIVEAVGEEVTKLKVGDKIIFSSYGVDEVRVNREKLFFLKEDDILAKCEL